MAALRMRIRVPGEAVKPHEAHFKLHAEEVPVKNKVRRCRAALLWALHCTAVNRRKAHAC